MAMIKMSLADWHDMPDNPRQRDTERRADWAKSRHLSEYHKTHDYVFAATIGGDCACKLDGHTRDYLWQAGELDPPPNGQVQCLLIEVENLGEAKQLYDDMDSKAACKRPHDSIFGATRENKFRLRSSLMRGCAFFTQLKLADTATFCGDPYDLVKRWKGELQSLDAMSLSKKHTVLIAAMLISLRRDGIEMAGPFWKALDNDAGVKDAKGSDGVQLLSNHMSIRKAEGRTAGYDNLRDILDCAWWCYETFLAGKRAKRVRRSSIANVIADLKPQKKARKAASR